MADLWIIVAVAGAAGIASPLGGLVAIWRQPTTLLMSLALGFAGGTLLGTIAFKMVPEAVEMGSLAIARPASLRVLPPSTGSICGCTAAGWRERTPSSARRYAASIGAIRRAATR